MLNSNIVKLAEALDKLCVEGYNTIDKKDILASLAEDFECVLTIEGLDEELKKLIENKFIIVKYQDSEQICLTFTESGLDLIARVKIARQEQEATRKQKRALKKAQEENGEQGKFELVTTEKPNAIMSNLLQDSKRQKKNKIKAFIIVFLGGIFGGAIAGVICAVIITLLM